MRHFSHISDEDVQRLFFRKPENFDVNSDKRLIASALGATLYTPATRPELPSVVQKLASKGVISVVMCLEDSIPDDRLPEAESNLRGALIELETIDPATLPLLFVRVRNPEHLAHVIDMNRAHLDSLAGFVLPKFEDVTGVGSHFGAIMELLNSSRRAEGKRELYFMPVLESALMVYRETRDAVIYGVRDVLSEHNKNVLAVRIGATDMASPYAIRRSRDLTIYDVHVVASAIGDVVNILGRAGTNGYVVTGAVWEHFTDRERLFKPRLRQTPFEKSNEVRLRRELLVKDLDGLIREVELDRANGLLGKTVIHPTHVSLVHSMMVVSHEEYSDALDITGDDKASGGASASIYRNKMNEVKPHLAWAEKTLLRAKAFGVSNADVNFVDMLEASITL